MNNLMNSNSEFNFNEVIFENRNKTYGAYVLRNEEGNMLTKALLVGVAFFATVAITPLLINSFTALAPPIVEDNGHTLTPVDNIPDDVKPPVSPVIPPKTIEQTVTLELPTPTRDTKRETPATSVSDLKDAKIGIENIDGVPPTISISPPVVQNVVVVPPIVAPKPVSNAPSTKVDVEAKFNGGIDAFRNKVVQNFDAGKFEGSGGIIKTTVTFIVEKDGTISGISATGPDAGFNREAEKTVKYIKGKWMPAKLNGENVRSYFNFPISMQFE